MMELNKIYFFTASILKWLPLLKNTNYKSLVVDSLRHLVQAKKISLYGFVIMPNHIHLVWELLAMNGRESPHASFMKYTSHQMLKDLRENYPSLLNSFKVEKNTRNHQFWQRDALSVHLYTPAIIYQKLDYVHNNPVQGKWMLADSPQEYCYSSARFYATGIDDFEMLTHIGERM
ncbi:transposase [Catalinimonas niigatensis]|uniref:transposase n=1 Tax=Catalinimonas niigatensis TaxID=1397264 RepID=UPI002664E8E8|nr:transposase [Catalinimonas niigatensis]WPP49850.1 transposase [Catalinimonas niigatensis]